MGELPSPFPHLEPAQRVGMVWVGRRPLLDGHGTDALHDQFARLGVEHERHAERRRRALARVIVGPIRPSTDCGVYAASPCRTKAASTFPTPA